MVTVWTGREANALREAMRLSIDDFAALARISRRSVANWSSRGDAMRLRWDAQRSLDRLLAAASHDVHVRLDHLLAAGHDTRMRLDHLPAADHDTRMRLDHPPAASHDTRMRLDHPPAASHDTRMRLATEPGRGAPDLVATLVNPPEPEHDDAAPALIRLERAVAHMRMGYQACRIRETSDRLPRLMRTLRSARASRDPSRVGKLAAEAYHVASELLLKLGDVPLSMFAAERCAQEARTSEQPLAVAASDRATASVLLRSGHADTAAALSARAAQRLREATTLDGPRPLSGYGALLLTEALAHARLGDRAQAIARLDDAARVADGLGFDGNHGWTAFGPTNVALHRLSALLALGDPGGALHAVEHLEPEHIRPAERQAAYYLDTAAALQRMGKPQEATAATAHAARIAPELVATS